MKILLSVLTLLFVLNSCKNKQPRQQQAPTADSTKAQKNSALSDPIEGTPAWFEQLPQKKGYLYALGQAHSLRPNLARDKAVLQARVRLARKVRELDERPNRPPADGGAKETVPHEEARQTVLEKSMIKRQKQIKKGKQWQVFVLLEMKVK